MLTCSISGFGGSYEWGCQRMLELGLKWLAAHPDFDFRGQYKEYENIKGIASPLTAAAQELDAAMQDDPTLRDFGTTGAMHQYTMHHLAYIHIHGREAWLSELRRHREPGDFFEFDCEAMRPARDLEIKCGPDSDISLERRAANKTLV